MESITFHIGDFHRLDPSFNHIDPNLEPADYMGWGVSGSHVRLVDTGHVGSDYLDKLELELINAGAKGVSYE